MIRAAFALLLLTAAIPAPAEVAIGEHGFATDNSVTVAASPQEIWAALVEPARYWNPDHSWFGDAGNFSLDPVAGGCFCEIDGERSAEHMRVVMVQPGAVLRLTGALGPLQSEGLTGSLTWQLEAVDGGTRISQRYVVGGHMAGFDVAAIAPAVDGVVREQLERLAALFAESD
ncbi:MAG: SRPBCC domain-containing protein [Parasphingopyxis sp.]